MTRYEYDEEASERLHMDVVHEVDDRPTPVARWVDAMRRLNSINDPLARRLLALHRDCGSGSGVCDSVDDESVSIGDRRGWGCETTEAIADHFGSSIRASRSGEVTRSCSRPGRGGTTLRSPVLGAALRRRI